MDHRETESLREEAARHIDRGGYRFVNRVAWHIEARRIRADERIPYTAIARRLGVSRSEVVRVCKDVDVGEKLTNHFERGRVVPPEEIAARVATRRANAVSKPPPPCAPKVRTPRREPAWYAEARRIRADEKIACWKIAARLGRSNGQVKRVCADVDLGVDLRHRFRPGHRHDPEHIRRAVEVRRANMAPKVVRHRSRRDPVPQSSADVRRARVRRLLAADHHPRPTITLPRVSILENAL